jgi:hypothetical protein
MLTFDGSKEAAYPAGLTLRLETLAMGTYIVTDGVSATLLSIVR